jgi:hypothetical protein
MRSGSDTRWLDHKLRLRQGETMQKRKLGSSNLEVSALGLGCISNSRVSPWSAVGLKLTAWPAESNPDLCRFSIIPSSLAFAERMRLSLGLTIEVSDSVATVVETADMVLASTWARTPFILPGMLQPGTHVSTIGPDEPGKCEVSAEVIRDAVFVCDDRDLAVSMGAIGGAKLGADAISAELGEVIGGAHPGRMNAEQITVYGGVGLAFQDAVAAWQIYRAALSRGLGREIDFLA